MSDDAEPRRASDDAVGDVDAVIELLERWRDATGMARMRIGIDATRTIAALPAARKRSLAIEVAERVAPQLVPAIQAESGDLTAEQVGAVVDLLRRADEQQLDDLVTALRSGEVGEARDLVDEAVAVVGPPGPATEELLEEVTTADADRDAPTHGVNDDRPTAPSPPTGAVAGAASGAVAAAAAAMGDDDEIDVAADGSLALDEDAVRERLQAEAAQRADRYRDSSRDVPTTPAYRAPTVDFRTEDLELPDPDVEAVAPLHERMEQQPDRDGPRRLAAAPVAHVVASVTGTPDGYRRRRAALEAIRAGRLEPADVAPVVRSFDRATDRSWIAGAALDAGLASVGSLDELDLPPTAVARLRRRAR